MPLRPAARSRERTFSTSSWISCLRCIGIGNVAHPDRAGESLHFQITEIKNHGGHAMPFKLHLGNRRQRRLVAPLADEDDLIDVDDPFVGDDPIVIAPVNHQVRDNPSQDQKPDPTAKPTNWGKDS